MRAAPPRRRRWTGALLLLLALALARPALAEKRVALVIGNGGYAYAPALDNPARDARLIAATAKELGFTLVGDRALVDLDRPSLERAIREFGRAIGPGTVAMFYYSGHGLQLRGGNYLVPVSARLGNASDVDFELIDVDIVVRQMDAAHSSLNLIILDACRNNPFGGRGLRDGSAGLAEMRAPPATLISYATQPGGVAEDGEPGGDSPYSLALSEGLRTRGIDVFKAFNLVGVKVRHATNGKQTPWVAASPIEGEFFLASAPATNPTPPTPPPPPAAAALPSDREALFWQSVQGSNRPEELEAYLRRFPDGTFADLARSRLVLLQPPVRPLQIVPAPPPAAAQPPTPTIVSLPVTRPLAPGALYGPPAPAEIPRPRADAPAVPRPPRPALPARPAPAKPEPSQTAAILPPLTQPPPARVIGFSATAADARGRRYQSNNTGSEGDAVGAALRMCHAGPDGGSCRIIGMAHAGG